MGLYPPGTDHLAVEFDGKTFICSTKVIGLVKIHQVKKE